MTYDELDRLFSAPDELEDLTFLHLGIFGGLRIREIVFLRVRDILFDDYTIHVRPETAKFGKERWVPVTPTTISLLKIISKGKEPDDRIYTRGIRAYQLRFDKLAEKGGIERNVHPHMMRHTCASLQLVS